MRRFVLLAIVVAGCQPAGPTPLPEYQPPPQEVAALVAGNTAFAVELYQQLAKEPGNVFCSPLSISTALTMTRRGATGQTATEMDVVLHLPADPHPAMKQIAAALAKPADGCEVAMANALFGQKQFGWKPDFLNDLSANYGAGLREVDFVGDTEAARQTINGWVEEQTRNKIRELFPKGILSVDSRLVLANAVYFNAEWHTRFETARTRDGRFQLDDGSGVTVPFMSGDVTASRHWETEVDVFAIPYKGGEYEFVGMMPNKGRLSALESGLSAEKLADWLDKISAQKRFRFQIDMPKFEMTCEYPLKDSLKEMGMRRVFDSMAAELDAMRSPPPRLFVGAVQHKAFIRVDEKGTEAAAATGVEVRVKSDRSLRVNRPFLYLIRHLPTQSVVFLGRVSDPSKPGK